MASLSRGSFSPSAFGGFDLDSGSGTGASSWGGSWATSWGNSWGSVVVDPNAMVGSASFSINGALQVSSGEMQGSASIAFAATGFMDEISPLARGGASAPSKQNKKQAKKQVWIDDDEVIEIISMFMCEIC
jgi:hypothetical protein